MNRLRESLNAIVEADKKARQKVAKAKENAFLSNEEQQQKIKAAEEKYKKLAQEKANLSEKEFKDNLDKLEKALREKEKIAEEKAREYVENKSSLEAKKIFDSIINDN